MLHFDFIGVPFYCESRRSETDGASYEYFWLENSPVPDYLAKSIKEGFGVMTGYLTDKVYREAVKRLPTGNPRQGSDLDKAVRLLADKLDLSVDLTGKEVLTSKLKGYLKGRSAVYYGLAVMLVENAPKPLPKDSYVEFVSGLSYSFIFVERETNTLKWLIDQLVYSK